MRSWLQRRSFSRLLATILDWTAKPDLTAIARQTNGWSPSDWRQAEQVIFMHGLGPLLQHDLLQPNQAAPAGLRRFQRFLEAQHSGNRNRIQRLQRDLSAILAEAHRRRIAIMPLKGSLLGLGYYPEPALRPMADLDLLIRPEHAQGLDEALIKLGYDRIPADNSYAAERHIRYQLPDNRTVVAWTEEHPGNPRPVEVHTDLRRLLWGDLRLQDMAPLLWEGAHETSLLGEPAWVPRHNALLVHLAAHTLDHMMVATARAIQFFDLAQVSPLVNSVEAVEQSNWLFLPLRLAQRIYPRTGFPRDLAALGERVDSHLRHWAENVPLNGSCGLLVDPAPRSKSRWWVHWERWAANRWRLRLAYGRLPWPLAAIKHLTRMARHAAARLDGQPSISLAAPHPDGEA